MIESLRHEFEALDFKLENHSLKHALASALKDLKEECQRCQEELKVDA